MQRIILSALFMIILPAAVFSQQKPRVFITDSQSWEMGGGFGIGRDGLQAGGGGSFGGGARPQTVEVIKTFHERCPEITITSERSNADFVVLFNHEGGKGWLRDNKIAVFRNQGDLVQTSSTRILGNAVKDACRAIVPAAVR